MLFKAQTPSALRDRKPSVITISPPITHQQGWITEATTDTLQPLVSLEAELKVTDEKGHTANEFIVLKVNV